MDLVLKVFIKECMGKETGDSLGVFLILLVGKIGHFLGKSAGNTVSNAHAG